MSMRTRMETEGKLDLADDKEMYNCKREKHIKI